MTDYSDIAAKLAALSDAELVAVLRPVVAGRPALWALRNALEESSDVHHAELVDDVSPATGVAPSHDAPAPDPGSGQVGGGIPVPPVPVPPTGIPGSPTIGGYSPSGVPSFDSVRDKVEQRFGTAQGMGELDRQTPAGRSAEEQFEAREKAARDRLDQIRKSVRGNDVDS
ncbi:PspA/IM30 family protein [Nocardia aurea]|uniref:PspA/IM30 family protein n=1 Tax=Nocardia aurea TaxID=2144174 RepID=UPI0033B4064B